MQLSRQTSSNSSRNNNVNVVNSSFTSRSSRTDSSRSSGSGGGGGSSSTSNNNNNRRNSSGKSSTRNNRSSRSMVGIEAAQLDVPHLDDDDDDMTHASSSIAAAASSADAAAGYPPSFSGGASFASGSHRSTVSSNSGRSSVKKRNSQTKKKTSSSESTSAIIIEDEETSSNYYYNESNIEWGSVSSRTELSDSLKQEQFDTVNISGTFHTTSNNNNLSTRSRMDTRRSSLDQTLTTIDYNSSSAKSLNLEMPTSSNETNQSRRSSLIFESLWEGTSNLWNSSRSLFTTNGNQNDDASHHHHHDQGGIQFGTKHTHNLRSNRYNYEEEDDDSSFAPSVASLTSSEECSSKHMQLLRTLSGRVAFMRNPSCRIANNSGVSDDDSLKGYGMGGYTGRKRCTRYTKYIMGHVKFTLLCLIISVAMAVSIGTLIVMIPLWINEDKRDVSGEVGGLVYAGDGEVTDKSVTEVMKDDKGSLNVSDGSGSNAVDEQKLEDDGETGDWELGAEAQDLSSTNNSNHGGGWTNEEKVPVLPSLDIGISSSSSSSSSSSTRPPTKTFFKPPPYELQDVCSSSSIADPDRYGECVDACLPSRCCLVPETKPYEVWTIPSSWNSSSDTPSVIMNTEDTNEDKVTIGTIIPSCFLQHADLCVTYNHQCSILDTSVLLPRKPPTDEEVSKMNNSEKLKLAEWVNHSCGKLHKTRRSSEESECHLLCQEKACCFVDDPTSEESSTTTPLSTNSTEDTKPNLAFLRHRNRRVVENDDPEMVYMGIPGEEGLEYADQVEEELDQGEEFTSPPEEANQTVVNETSALANSSSVVLNTTKEEVAVVPNNKQLIKEETIVQKNVSSSSTKGEEKDNLEIIENCVSDVRMFCLTYTGCGPLFNAN